MSGLDFAGGGNWFNWGSQLGFSRLLKLAWGIDFQD